MNLILLMAICLGISLVFSELFFRLRVPKVIGQIFAGIVLGYYTKRYPSIME